MQDIREQRAER